MDEIQHIPVLLDGVLANLSPKQGETYLDLTAGYGGHATRILERTFTLGEASVLVDRDQFAVTELNEKFKGQNVQIIHKDFLSAALELKEQGRRFNIILADLGVSSPHLDIASRGFAIRYDGPLDMRMDQRQQMTAEEVINTYSEEQLRDLIRKYSEEPHAGLVARAIVQNRPMQTTKQLADVVARAWRGARPKVHPATRTFQAVRIAVNDELGMLERALPIMVDLLAPNGRLGIITFHSLEDRIVKQFFKDKTGNRYDAELIAVTNKPLEPTTDEIVFNPRSRSAKLRVVSKK